MSPLETAISRAGGISALARAMGFPYPSTVSNWKQAGIVPEEQCPAIEAITGVKCEELRDDVEWTRGPEGKITGYHVRLVVEPRAA